ncbi:Retrovirus-related Pol polyprotein from transposon [Nosema granulosis]|uniref:Retrovirus-related Pol polyprotein from transposon n=1 Tax=Nosema granulosis TaxID=83296 RepID=A0A9P6GWC1_9MICR|nr:Retrovirus-related Pol polyprotein from transposon [Nosema granulosis]
MALNELVEKDPYALPLIKDIIRGATQGPEVFTVIDLKEGFYHVEIEEHHKHKTAFEVNGRVYGWNSMVMGFKNSPHIMQRVMNNVLDEFRGKGVEVYMDDIVVHAKDARTYDLILKKVIMKFKDSGLRVNPNKIQYKLDEVKLLGVTINGENVGPNEIKKQETLEYRRPENVKELRRFLGSTGWFRDFIPNYAYRTVRLTEALKKDVKWEWTEDMELPFNDPKLGLRNMQKLKISDNNKSFRLRTDACDTGIGAILLHEDKEGRWASKMLTPTEKRYTINEKDMLAVLFGIKKFESDLRGRKFHLMTDHKALAEIRNKPFFNNNRINRVLKECERCNINNRKTAGGFDFVVTRRKLEKVALDLMDIGEENRYVLVGIDYFTRRLWGARVRSKETKAVLEVLQKWISEDGFPEEYVTDNGKEFVSNEFKVWCSENEIKHWKVGLEAHRSNGRIERCIRTIREAVVKQGDGTLDEKIEKAIKVYNNSLHTAIKCTPMEAWRD